MKLFGYYATYIKVESKASEPKYLTKVSFNTYQFPITVKFFRSHKTILTYSYDICRNRWQNNSIWFTTTGQLIVV